MGACGLGVLDSLSNAGALPLPEQDLARSGDVMEVVCPSTDTSGLLTIQNQGATMR